jgi:hypothetical protein
MALVDWQLLPPTVARMRNLVKRMKERESRYKRKLERMIWRMCYDLMNVEEMPHSWQATLQAAD